MARSLNKSISTITDNIHSLSISNNVAAAEEYLWKPQPGPQEEAFNSKADELLYGGASGGGKSSLLILNATLQQKRSIIFRREYPRLKDIIEKSRKVLTQIARYNSNEKIWRDIPGDRTLEFGAVQYEDSVESFRGIEHDFKGFDELTEFSKAQYQFLITWNRSSESGVRCRAIATCNPPTSIDSEWIIDYWSPWLKPDHPNPALPGELRWFAVVDGEEIEVENGEVFEHNLEQIQPRSRTFIPARLEDNAYLKDSNYRGVLQRLEEPLRSQLLYGDFTAKIKSDHPWQVIPSEWVDLAVKRWTPRPNTPLTHLGCDVARGGKDESIIVKRHATYIGEILAFPGSSTPNGDTLGEQILICRTNSKVEVRIDILGVGCSVYDYLKREKIPLLFGINGGRASEALDVSGALGFFNLRSQMWWQLRELLDPKNNHNVALPNDPKLIGDLTAPRWSTAPSKHKLGVIRIESKDDIIKRLGRSPDRGDALAYAFANLDNYQDDSSYKWLNNL